MVGMVSSLQLLRARVVGDAIFLGKSTILAKRVVVNGLWNLDRPKPEAAARLLSMAYGKRISVIDGTMRLYEQACQALLRNPNEAERLLAHLSAPAGEVGEKLDTATRLLKCGVAPDRLDMALRREHLGLLEAPSWAEHLTLCDEGVVLGEGTVIVPLAELPAGGTGLEIAGHEASILALLSIARAELAPPQVLEKLASASRALAKGNVAQAAIALCQMGQPPLQDRAMSKSLAFAADRLEKGVPANELMKAYGFIDQGQLSKATARGWDPNKHPRQSAGCHEGGQFCTSGNSGQKSPPPTKEPNSARHDIAGVASGYEGSKKWLYNQDGKQSYKCNQFVADVLREAGIPVDGLHQTLTGSAPPTAGDWADPDVEIPGWEVIDPKDAKPGDVIAETSWWEHLPSTPSGHVGIVVGDKLTASSSSSIVGPWKGMITVNDWGFRPGQQVVVRRYVGTTGKP